jgi:hypothetical protein
MRESLFSHQEQVGKFVFLMLFFFFYLLSQSFSSLDSLTNFFVSQLFHFSELTN